MFSGVCCAIAMSVEVGLGRVVGVTKLSDPAGVVELILVGGVIVYVEFGAQALINRTSPSHRN